MGGEFIFRFVIKRERLLIIEIVKLTFVRGINAA